MSILLKKFKGFIQKQQLFKPDDPLLVAVSGGLDSVVLAHLLQALNHPISIAHCNFQLRGDASDQDADFVGAFAKANKTSFHLKTFDTGSYASAQQLSTQVAARELRYAWFNKLMSSHDFKYLITAHHANDQVETVLYNLTKGTGIAGLRGIPLKNEHIRRPLLFAKRKEIEAYAKIHRLAWREDPSNQKDKYSRNHIRLHVVPKLKKINSSLEQTMRANSRRFGALEKLLLTQTDQIRDRHLTKTNDTYSLSMAWYDEAQGGWAILNELLKPFGFNADQCFSIDEAMKDNGANAVGKQFFSSRYVLAIDRGKIEIVPKGTDIVTDLSVGPNTEFISTPMADFVLDVVQANSDWPKDKNVACLDADLVKFPMKIRNWSQGDAFRPLGMDGKKKLSDFMIDEKIPVNLKPRLLLFESVSNIIWVAGHRIDDRYKITPITKQVLIIKMTTHV